MDFLIEDEFERMEGPLTALEPCCGMRDIADVLADDYDLEVCTMDIDPRSRADTIGDFITHPLAELGWVDWVITNPPYQTDQYHAVDFIKRTLKIGTATGVAHLVRMSILEPCDNRVNLLQELSPSYVLYLPRPRFKWGKTDSVTSVWLVWVRGDDGAWLPTRQNGLRFFGNEVREKTPEDWVSRYEAVGDTTIHLEPEPPANLNLLDTLMKGAAE